jgi:prepilin-type N-terminal cleavage/methylation domain-containing protein
MKNSQKKRGFTLVEILLTTVISVIVFGALGALLTRSFTLWMDSMANWKLAQHARVSRARLLDGAFGPGTGWMSASNVSKVVVSGGESYVQYYPLGTGGTFRVYGWGGSSAVKDLRLWNGGSLWALGQNAAATNYTGDVKVDLFVPNIANNIISATYQLRLSAMGKTFIQPCTVQVYVNNE